MPTHQVAPCLSHEHIYYLCHVPFSADFVEDFSKNKEYVEVYYWEYCRLVEASRERDEDDGVVSCNCDYAEPRSDHMLLELFVEEKVFEVEGLSLEVEIHVQQS